MLSVKDLDQMKRKAILIDISIDQGGSFETSQPTTHDNPYFVKSGVIHYCVTNMPSAAPKTATQALCQATLPYIIKLASLGTDAACMEYHELKAGLNIHSGRCTLDPVIKNYLTFRRQDGQYKVFSYNKC